MEVAFRFENCDFGSSGEIYVPHPFYYKKGEIIQLNFASNKKIMVFFLAMIVKRYPRNSKQGLKDGDYRALAWIL